MTAPCYCMIRIVLQMKRLKICLTKCFCSSLFISLTILLTAWSYLSDYPTLYIKSRPQCDVKSTAAKVIREYRLSQGRRLLDIDGLINAPDSKDILTAENLNECNIPTEKRFDCARDRALSRVECENRNCCYVPLRADLYSGPPWCFYPPSYPGYKIGSFVPTSKGRAANLTRSIPSYLPKDIPTLRLEVAEETAGRLHITVSQKGQ